MLQIVIARASFIAGPYQLGMTNVPQAPPQYQKNPLAENTGAEHFCDGKTGKSGGPAAMR
jgi:hypothetical protein